MRKHKKHYSAKFKQDAVSHYHRMRMAKAWKK